MAFLDEHKAKFENLKVALNSKNRGQLRRTANGGNSILFTYSSDEEIPYLNKAHEIFSKDKYVFIDLAKLFVKYIDINGWADFEEYYQDFIDTPHKVFKSDDEETDFMDLIIEKIVEADTNNLTPILIRTGILYGTGVENVNIMEHKTVMCLKQILVFFYPSKLEDDNLLFLNFKLANKYRCTVIE